MFKGTFINYVSQRQLLHDTRTRGGDLGGGGCMRKWPNFNDVIYEWPQILKYILPLRWCARMGTGREECEPEEKQIWKQFNKSFYNFIYANPVIFWVPLPG